VEVEEAEHEAASYRSFGEFFSRRLKQGARPISGGEKIMVSPCDGTVGAFGDIEAGNLVQAKGRDYSLEAFLGGEEQAQPFVGGQFLTVYLSPRNYHRVHQPIQGTVEAALHVPGTLWPVGPTTLGSIDGVFVANERLVSFSKCTAGSLAVVMVGATCVGRMRASYDDIVTNTGELCSRRSYQPGIAYEKGQELGVFEMGSTVVLVMGGGRLGFDPKLEAGMAIRMGEAIGEWEP